MQEKWYKMEMPGEQHEERWVTNQKAGNGKAGRSSVGSNGMQKLDK